MIDAKSLQASRTPIEVARELKCTFATEAGERPAAIDRHLKRVEFVKAHLAPLLGWAGFDSDGSGWRIRPALVTNAKRRGVEALPIPVMSIAELRYEVAHRSEHANT